MPRYRVYTGNYDAMGSVDLMASSAEDACSIGEKLIPEFYNDGGIFAVNAEDEEMRYKQWVKGRICLSYGVHEYYFSEACLTDKQISTIVESLTEIRSFNKNKLDWVYDLAVKYDLPLWYARALRG